jgi:hypothetical protein
VPRGCDRAKGKRGEGKATARGRGARAGRRASTPTPTRRVSRRPWRMPCARTCTSLWRGRNIGGKGRRARALAWETPEPKGCEEHGEGVRLGERDKAMLRQLYIVKPDDLVALIAQRTGLTIRRPTLKVWRKAVPLVLPTSREAADDWIYDVMKTRNERKTARRERMARAGAVATAGQG